MPMKPNIPQHEPQIDDFPKMRVDRRDVCPACLESLACVPGQLCQRAHIDAAGKICLGFHEDA